MKRLLFRAGKSPLTPVSAETALAQDVLNANAGNAVFQNAVWRALSTRDHELVANATLSERRKASAQDAARINEQFDAFVVPLANAFRPEFAPMLDRLSSLIESLDIPVIVIGVGAQAPTSYETEHLDPLNASVTRFMKAVLDRSAALGVRGELTASYLAELGFGSEHVEVIGCPSLFFHGSHLRIEKSTSGIDAHSRLAINLSPGAGPVGGEFVTRQAERYPHLDYVTQGAKDLDLLLWGKPRRDVLDPRVPDHMGHPLYREDRMRLFLDPRTWMDYLAQKDFVYGTRIHGNITALISGTPSFVLAHDSRTLELARYHGIPHRVASPVDPSWDAAELFAEADYSEFNRLMPERFATYVAFLDRNGLDHIWNHDGQDNGFTAELAAADLPGPVHTLCRPGPEEIASRLQWLRAGQRFDHTRHSQAFAYDFDVPSRRSPGNTDRRKLEQRLADQQQQIDALTQQIDQSSAVTTSNRSRRIRRRIGAMIRRN